MDPDFVSGDGEIVIHSRNVFMGYAKVCAYHNYQNLILPNFACARRIILIYNYTISGRN